jgi:hypothetical protein
MSSVSSQQQQQQQQQTTKKRRALECTTEQFAMKKSKVEPEPVHKLVKDMDEYERVEIFCEHMHVSEEDTIEALKDPMGFLERLAENPGLHLDIDAIKRSCAKAKAKAQAQAESEA